jgi:proteasome beta subunit
MTQTDESMDTGTTTLGLLGEDYVLLAADRRASVGKFIASHNVNKVQDLTDHIAVTTSGSVSTIQLVKKVAQARLRLKNLQSRRLTTVKEAANLITNINFRNARAPRPEIAHFLLGGFDDEGPHLFDIFPDGSLMKIPSEKGYYASGSGSQMALGLLEESWEQNMSEDEAAKLAVKAIRSAVQRDAGSGSGVLAAVIDEDGYRVVRDEDVRPTIEE